MENLRSLEAFRLLDLLQRLTEVTTRFLMLTSQSLKTSTRGLRVQLGGRHLAGHNNSDFYAPPSSRCASCPGQSEVSMA